MGQFYKEKVWIMAFMKWINATTARVRRFHPQYSRCFINTTRFAQY